MEQLEVSARFKIHAGKLAEFKHIAAQCLKSVQDKDTGTLKYDWFLNEDQGICEAREVYSNSGAALEHMGNLGELLGRIAAISDADFHIYGDPSPELQSAAAALAPAVYSKLQGL